MQKLVGKRVFDFVPDNEKKPYIALGTPVSQDWGSHTFDGFEFTYTIHGYTESAGKKEAMQIAKRIYSLLHDVDLAITAFETVSCREVLSQVIPEPDGKTHHALIQYRIILGGNPK